MNRPGCKRCGQCCRAIVIKASPEKLALDAKDDPDVRFLHENWVPITREEAFRINPHLKTWPEINMADRYFYHCTRIDSVTNRCTVHEGRPGTCSGFPCYTKKGIQRRTCRVFLYSPACGYSLPEEERQELIRTYWGEAAASATVQA